MLHACKLLIALLCIQSAQAQNNVMFMNDPRSGRPLTLSKYEQYQGSAFLFDDWKKATVYAKDGTVFANVEMKFDVHENKFYYIQNNNTYYLQENVQMIKLFLDADTNNAMIFRNGFDINASIGPASFVQILHDGKVKLVKFTQKFIIEYSEYNNPNKLKAFSETVQYFGFLNNKWQSVKLSKKDAEKWLGTDYPQLIKQGDSNNLNLKTEAGWIALLKLLQ